MPKVKAVINAARSCSGRYPNLGPSVLLSAGIPVVDNAGRDLFKALREGERVELHGGSIHRNGSEIASGEVLTVERAERVLGESKAHLGAVLEEFAENTLLYVTQEKSLLLDPANLPPVKTSINGRHALVVVRGETYKEDLAIIRTYIRDMKPVLIGVDGGADALLEMGLAPDMIVGDMDSVSDAALGCGAEIIVHAYSNGDAPGLPRVESLGLAAELCSVPGTSEDLALLLAYEEGAAADSRGGDTLSPGRFSGQGPQRHVEHFSGAAEGRQPPSGCQGGEQALSRPAERAICRAVGAGGTGSDFHGDIAFSHHAGPPAIHRQRHARPVLAALYPTEALGVAEVKAADNSEF